RPRQRPRERYRLRTAAAKSRRASSGRQRCDGVIAEAALSACMGSVGCGRAGVVGRGEMTLPPVEDGLEALPTMARLTGPGQLVVLSREDEHLGVHPCPLQGRVV